MHHDTRASDIDESRAGVRSGSQSTGVRCHAHMERRVGNGPAAVQCEAAHTRDAPTDARGVGTGFAYHLGVGIAASSPYIVGALQDGGMDLRKAMLMCIVGGATSILLLLWMGPETRGRELG